MRGGIRFPEIDLSVIIITKNEEETIKDCLQSVIEAVRFSIKHNVFFTAEIILVDSASSDRTLEIARTFPVTILEMPRTWKVSAAAGRYFGVKHSRGKYISMVDGDTTIRKDWYEKGFATLRANKMIAGVCGRYLEHIKTKSVTEKLIYDAEFSHKTGEIDTISVGLFRKKAVLDIGSYNPHFAAAEDKEFTKRGLMKNYRFIRIDDFEGEHFTSGKGDKIYTFIDYLKRFLWYGTGEGQVARYHLRYGSKRLFINFTRYYFNLNFTRVYVLLFLYMALVGLNLLIMATGLFFPYGMLGIIIVDITIIALWIGARKSEKAFKVVLIGAKLFPEFSVSPDYRTLLFTLSVIPYVICSQAGFIIGFNKKPKRVEEYPQNISKEQVGDIIT